MENRTKLKEKRNNYLWIVFMTVFVIGLMLDLVSLNKADQDDYAGIVFIGVPWLFIFYRVLTFCFNFILAKIVKKRFKIDRLKGRITPIYKIKEKSYLHSTAFLIEKFSVKYTSLDLEWSIPFSVLFEEQEYIKEGEQRLEVEYDKVGEVNIADFYEKEKNKQDKRHNKKISAKASEQEKIDYLNKIFNENYK